MLLRKFGCFCIKERKVSLNRGGIRTNGLKGKKRRYYEKDYTHQDLEEYDSRGKHIGSVNPQSGKPTKSAVPGRKNGNIK
ncbi:MAG: hypothetical protein KDH19_01865 [Geminicoccaceae bacterium]|nr:hypothetical protein [Geminicoccaceae bacterium]